MKSQSRACNIACNLLKVCKQTNDCSISLLCVSIESSNPTLEWTNQTMLCSNKIWVGIQQQIQMIRSAAAEMRPVTQKNAQNVG